MPLERAGGQAQFIVPRATGHHRKLAAATARLAGRQPACPLTLADIAEHASTSTRSLSRHFRQQTGTTPQQWLNRQRFRRAQQLLEETRRSVEQIGELVGFTSPTGFRECFRQIVGVSPRDHRRAFPPG
jgi:transcriptional regulator GlxA family with amidase domain